MSQSDIFALLAEEAAFTQEALTQALDNYPLSAGDPSELLLVIDTLAESALALEVTDFIEHTDWVRLNTLKMTQLYPSTIPPQQKQLLTQWLALFIELFQDIHHSTIRKQLQQLFDSPDWLIPCPNALHNNLFSPSNNSISTTNPEITLNTVDLSPSIGLDPRLWDAFIAETPDLAASFIQLLRDNNTQIDCQSAENMAYSIKGGANLVGISAISQLVERLESLFEASENITFSAQQITTLQQCAEVLEAQFTYIGEPQAPSHTDSAPLVQELDEWIHHLESGSNHSDLLIEDELADDWIDLQFSSDLDPRLIDAFYQETPDIVTELSKILALAPSGAMVGELITEAQRLAHTLKGSASLVGLSYVEEIAHKLEDAMELLEDNDADSDLAFTLLETGDLIETMFDALLNQETGIHASMSRLLSTLANFVNQHTDEDTDDTHSLLYQEDEAQTTVTIDLSPDPNLNPLLWDAFMEETPDLVDQLSIIVSDEPANLFGETAHDAEVLSHTIKGAGKLVCIDPISNLAYILEEVFEQLAETSTPLNENHQTLLIKASDILQLQFALIGQQDAPSETDPSDVIAHLKIWLQQLEQGADNPQQPIENTAVISPIDGTEWIDLSIPDEVDYRLIDAFFEEAPDQASELSGMLQNVLSDDFSMEKMVEAQRLAHTIKGSAALLGLGAIEGLTHRLEDVMETMGDHQADESLSTTLLEAGDLLESMFDALTQKESGIVANLAHILTQLDHYVSSDDDNHVFDLDIASRSTEAAGIDLAMPMETNLLLWDAFMTETPGQASELIALLVDPESITQDIAKQAERLSHTVRGSSALIGFPPIVQLCEILESIFEQLHNQTVNDTLAEYLLQAADILDLQFSSLGGMAPKEADSSALCPLLEQQLEQLEHPHKTFESNTHSEQAIPHDTQTSGSTDLTISPDLDPRLIEAFFIEAPDQATELSKMLQGDLQNEHIIEAQRLAHTIKGSAALLGIWSVEALAHRLEDVMEGLEGTQPPPELTELFLETGDFIESIFDALLAKKDRLNQSSDSITQRLSTWAEKLNPEKLAHDENASNKEGEEPEFTPIDPTELVWSEQANPDLVDQFFMDTPEQVEQLSALLLNNQVATDKGLKEARLLTGNLLNISEKIGIQLLHKFTHDLQLILNNMTIGQVSDAGLTVLEDAGSILTNVFDAIQGISELDNDISSRLWLFKEWAHRVASQAEEIEETPTIKTETPKESSPEKTKQATKKPLDTPQKRQKEQKAAPQVTTTLRVPTERIDALIKLVGEMTTTISQLQGRLNSSVGQVHGIQSQSDRTADKLQELETLIINKHAPEVNQNEDTAPDFDPLEMDQYHELNSISSFLNESFSDSQKMAQYADDELSELNNIIHVQERLSREVNEAVLATRMLSVDQLTPRLERAVREAARASGKKATLDIVGEELLIDTDIINGLRDPLMHLLRNSVDHGIEKPVDRETAGKETTGYIRTSFSRQGNTILVQIQDDGAGFNLERIKQTALSRGLEISDAVSETEILRLILQPGFSTKENVTKLSGRGIGMDVVAQAVTDLNGTIQINNRKETAGSEIILRLPLTLVSAPVLLVKSVEQTFSIPGDDIHQILFPEPGSIVQESDHWYFKHSGNSYYLHSLNALLGREDKQEALKRHNFAPILLVHDEYNIQAVALDFAIERRDVVIQRLGRWLPDVPGVSGACILADGSISPVVDLKALLHNPDAIHLDLSLLQDEARLMGAGKQAILVVDDSLSARLSLQLAVEQAGYEALTAIDGLNAIEVLEQSNNPPIAVVTDMEMPKMNGLELTRHIKTNDQTAHLPVVMITSRSTVKHRNQAKAAGVDHYLTKPFDNAHLNSVIKELTQKDHEAVSAL